MKANLASLPGVALILGLSLTLSACSQSEAVQKPEQAPRAVRIETVGSDDALSSRRYVGRVAAVSTVDLSFQVGGRIIELPVQQGKIVPKGGLIAALDPADYKLAMREAQVQKDLAERNLARMRTLLGSSAVSRAEFERSEAEFRLREVALDNARRNLSLTRIEAPFDALITRRMIDAFSNVAPNTNVVRVQDVTELRVQISVPEDPIRLVSSPELLHVEAFFPTHPGRPFPLEYREHATEPDQVAQTYQVSFALQEGSDLDILPGMTATVHVRLKEGAPEQSVDVPVSAINPDGNGGFRLWIYDGENGIVTPRAVQIGVLSNGRVPVHSGVALGEQIVTAGGHLLRDGLRVRPLETLR
jgi:RND family efflux transporter MFP subunit